MPVAFVSRHAIFTRFKVHPINQLKDLVYFLEMVVVRIKQVHCVNGFLLNHDEVNFLPLTCSQSLWPTLLFILFST